MFIIWISVSIIVPCSFFSSFCSILCIWLLRLFLRCSVNSSISCEWSSYKLISRACNCGCLNNHLFIPSLWQCSWVKCLWNGWQSSLICFLIFLIIKLPIFTFHSPDISSFFIIVLVIRAFFFFWFLGRLFNFFFFVLFIFIFFSWVFFYNLSLFFRLLLLFFNRLFLWVILWLFFFI